MEISWCVKLVKTGKMKLDERTNSSVHHRKYEVIPYSKVSKLSPKIEPSQNGLRRKNCGIVKIKIRTQKKSEKKNARTERVSDTPK